MKGVAFGLLRVFIGGALGTLAVQAGMDSGRQADLQQLGGTTGPLEMLALVSGLGLAVIGTARS